MAERGKYHGQRLKAKEVLRLYATGERDFRGAILRGCNFRGADLSDADFSETDLRGTKFTNSVLERVNFSRAKCGIETNWFLLRIALVSWLIFLFNIISIIAINFYTNTYIDHVYVVENKELILLFSLLVNLTIAIIFLGKGFKIRIATFISFFSILISVSL
ncbi:MAG: pentapeptide repeat-containing protein, partial [Leptolyngbya sp. SIO4C5]|nr:pentapeptide repeat-containing protein [Leptolyngbya sp. SIO4C5]